MATVTSVDALMNAGIRVHLHVSSVMLSMLHPTYSRLI